MIASPCLSAVTNARAVSRWVVREMKDIREVLATLGATDKLPRKYPCGKDRSLPQRYSPWIFGQPVIAKTLDALPPNIFTGRG